MSERVDWVERPEVVARVAALLPELPHSLAHVAAALESSVEDKAADHPARGVVTAVRLTAEQIECWFSARAKEIVSLSGLVYNGLELVRLGQEVCGVEGLHELADNLAGLATAVYECGAVDVTLEDYIGLSESDRIALLLRTSSAATIVHDIRTRVLPYVSSLSGSSDGSGAGAGATASAASGKAVGKGSGSGTGGQRLLLEFLVSLGSRDLPALAAVLQASKKTRAASKKGGGTSSRAGGGRGGTSGASTTSSAMTPLVAEETDVLEIALTAAYSSTDASPEVVAALGSIFDALPAYDEKRARADSDYAALQDRADAFYAHLRCMEILADYGLWKPLSFFVEPEASDATVLLTRLVRVIPQTHEKFAAAPNDAAWAALLADVLELRAKSFTVLSEEFCYGLVCESLLFFRKFGLVRTLPLSWSQVEVSVLAAARDAVNAANGPDDEAALANALDCLAAMPKTYTTPALTCERDFIAALRALVGLGGAALGVAAIPLNIRRLEDRSTIIGELLAHVPGEWRCRIQFVLCACGSVCDVHL